MRADERTPLQRPSVRPIHAHNLASVTKREEGSKG